MVAPCLTSRISARPTQSLASCSRTAAAKPVAVRHTCQLVPAHRRCNQHTEARHTLCRAASQLKDPLLDDEAVDAEEDAVDAEEDIPIEGVEGFSVEEAPAEEEEETETLAASEDWSDSKPGVAEEVVEKPGVAQYALNFLWLDKNVAVSVDQIFGGDKRSPMTEYFFWPRKDAWEELKATLETKPWISERDKVLLLNKVTEVINYWQDDATPKHSINDAREKFPDCQFQGV
ncbi:hypothetical protein WJX72_000113 [[Myrmecia] bisecta]|uniref:30S ribosomal protein 3, chloroplastic n=1 Tax=[Myrmecia] bisecta TaxID=41462 RepID=A0AAW1R4F3_9CHLO